jgi:hypothetical protein
VKTKTPAFHTTQYLIAATGCTVPLLGKPIFIAQCNWTRHFHEVDAKLFYDLLSNRVTEEQKVSYTENIGIIDTITQTVIFRCDLNDITGEDQRNFDTSVAALITERLISMKILPNKKMNNEETRNPFDNYGDEPQEEEGYQ